MTEYPFNRARWFHKGRVAKEPVKLLVIHSMEAVEKGDTAENVARYFHRGPVQASAHLCIDADSIVQCVKFEDTAFHCKGVNSVSIGLEHAGFAKQSLDEWLDEYGQRMLGRSAVAAAELALHFDIPVQRATFGSRGGAPVIITPGLCGHVDVPQHGAHWDPGPHFPWAWYLDKVEQALLELKASAQP